MGNFFLGIALQFIFLILTSIFQKETNVMAWQDKGATGLFCFLSAVMWIVVIIPMLRYDAGCEETDDAEEE